MRVILTFNRGEIGHLLNPKYNTYYISDKPKINLYIDVKGNKIFVIKLIFIFIFCLILLILFYSIFPTLFIRIKGIGITKKIKNTNGIALTFDDGPNPKYTVQLLDLLKEYGIQATFFVVGEKVVKNPEIIKRMHQEGHTIGIHHFNHISNWILSPFQLKKQLRLTEEVINKYTNEMVMFYRPPWGHFNIFTLMLSKRFNIIMWSHIFGDWKVENCKKTLLDQLRTATSPGSILLLHDCGETPGADEDAPEYMLKNLEIFLKECKKQGITFITLKDKRLI